MKTSAVCYLLAWTGTAPDTESNPTVHLQLQALTTPMDVVGGEDVEEPNTSM